MKHLVCGLIILFSALAQSAEWKESKVIGTSVGGSGHTVIFINTYYPEYTPTPNVWHTLDVTKLGVPVNANSVFIQGLLIITHGAAVQGCNLTVAFRAPGYNSITPAHYIFQAIEANDGGGQRSNAAAWVPLINGKLEWSYGRGDGHQWPAATIGKWPNECSYGVNLTISAYAR